ncbi:hypothetical protein CPB85DRAFT_1333139, partial [Mucidula mucida]
FMKMCPLVNKEWRATYDMLASRNVYIPSMQYLQYLLRIIATGQSHVHTASHFALRTRHIIVKTVRLDEDRWRFLTIPDNDASDIITSQLAHSSSTGLHQCFPAATLLVVENINTFAFPSYVGLRVQLDDRSTVTAEWRVDLGYPIQAHENWDRPYHLEMADAVAEALDTHMYIDAAARPDLDSVYRLLRLEGDRILKLKASWDLAPFSGKWTEELELYARRRRSCFLSLSQN